MLSKLKKPTQKQTICYIVANLKLTHDPPFRGIAQITSFSKDKIVQSKRFCLTRTK